MPAIGYTHISRLGREGPAAHTGRFIIAAGEATLAKPGLVLFYSPLSGRCRRVDGFLAQILQHRRNHDTFTVRRVDEARRPDLIERFRVDELPTLFVIEHKSVRARLVSPRNCRDIERFLAPWLR
jgi:thioredoxin-like negative regulator of GroEL